MLAFVAALLAGIATILSGAQVHSNAWISWPTFLCAAVLCLALHLAGVGTGYGPQWGRRVPPAA